MSSTGPDTEVTSNGADPPIESVTPVIVTGSTPVLVMVAVKSTVAPGSGTDPRDASLSTEMAGRTSVNATVASSCAEAEFPSSSATTTVAMLWCWSPALPSRPLVTSQRALSGPVPGWPSLGARVSPTRSHSAVMSPKTVSVSDVIVTASAAVFSITNEKVTFAPGSGTEVLAALLVSATVGTRSVMSTRASSVSETSLPSLSLASTSTTSVTEVPPSPLTSTVKLHWFEPPGAIVAPRTCPQVVAFTTAPVVVMSTAGPFSIESVRESTVTASAPGLVTVTVYSTSAPGSATLVAPATLSTWTRGSTSFTVTVASSESETVLSSPSWPVTSMTSSTTSPASPWTS